MRSTPTFLRGDSRGPQKLRSLLARDSASLVPGASNALVALLIERAGFDAVYITGAGVANERLGVPDVGLATLDDTLAVARAVVQVTSLPVIADVDTGYGNAINVMRTVRQFEFSGVAGIQLEDQVTPKRCGHFERKAVVSADEMVAKIEAAVSARANSAFVIIARTDAAATDGIDEAIRRARMYRDSGADAIFVEAPRNIEEITRIPKEVPGIPHVANMVEGGRTPPIDSRELSRLGYSLVLYANLPLRAAIQGVQRALTYLQQHGTSLGAEDLFATMADRQDIVGLEAIEALEDMYLTERSRRNETPRASKDFYR